MHLRWLSAGLAIAVGLAAWIGFAGPARASIGVGVQANPVSLSGAAHPGASYALPSLYVVNTGTQAESMSVRVVQRTGPGLAIPGSWIHIGGLSGQLPPKQSARIALELTTPGDAEPGNYVSDIRGHRLHGARGGRQFRCRRRDQARVYDHARDRREGPGSQSRAGRGG